MNPLKLSIHTTGNGTCALTGSECDGLTVTFDDGTVREQHLSWKAFRQLLSMKAGTKCTGRTSFSESRGAVGETIREAK